MRSVEDVQYLAGHSDLRSTRLYDGRPKQVTRKTVERISVGGRILFFFGIGPPSRPVLCNWRDQRLQ